MDGDDDRDFVGNIVFHLSNDTDLGDFVQKYADVVCTTNYDRLMFHLEDKGLFVTSDKFTPAATPMTTARVSGPTGATIEEERLQSILADEDADAVLGDLAELADRDAATMSSKEATKRRKARAREVRASLPRSAWRRLLRGFLYSMEMQSYWYGAVAFYLIYVFVYVIRHTH